MININQLPRNAGSMPYLAISRHTDIASNLSISNHNNIGKSVMLSFAGTIPFSIMSENNFNNNLLIAQKNNLYTINIKIETRGNLSSSKFFELLYNPCVITNYVLRRANKPCCNILIGNGLILTKHFEPIMVIGYNPKITEVVEYVKGVNDIAEQVLIADSLTINSINGKRVKIHYSCSDEVKRVNELSYSLRSLKNIIIKINRKFLNPEYYKGTDGYPAIIKKFIDSIVINTDLNVEITKNLKVIPTTNTVKNNTPINFNKLIKSENTAEFLISKIKELNKPIDYFLEQYNPDNYIAQNKNFINWFINN